MAFVSRRGFLGTGAALAALSACRQTTAAKAPPSNWTDAVSQAKHPRSFSGSFQGLLQVDHHFAALLRLHHQADTTPLVE